MEQANEEVTWREILQALFRVANFRPKFTLGVIVLGAGVAFLEGIGLSFIYPIIQVAQTDGPIEAQDAILESFLLVYRVSGVPFTLEYLILGIALIMTTRFTTSFLVAWLKAIIRKRYEETMRRRSFEAALNAEIEYFDQEGSDDILNAIITETRYSGRVIGNGIVAVETLFLVFVYLAVMIYIAPGMTVLALGLLGGITYVVRYVVEPGYTVGDRVAEANQQVQRAVQTGTQGIRDVKLFGLAENVYDDFTSAIRQYTDSSIDLAKNEAALMNFYDLAAALTLFLLIYIGFVFTGLSLGALGIFLFAMFRLAPLMSRLNSQVYKVEGNLSHLVRTQRFVDELQGRTESGGDKPISEIAQIEFDNVSFAYEPTDQILDGISFEVEKGDFIAFVGQSGAGKSTIVSLLTRFYEPDAGQIRANNVSISELHIREWRDRLAVVRQNPFIFNETLEYNVKIGNKNASLTDVEWACQTARVDEFIEELPNGYQSELGDDGVRLSGGQRQRVALARALITDADFLILDEATSDLDSNLEQEVHAAIESMEREYGIIAIAHRLSTVQNADVIYTLEAGEIIESGTHHDLIKNQDTYAQLYEIQTNT